MAQWRFTVFAGSKKITKPGMFGMGTAAGGITYIRKSYRKVAEIC